MVATKAVNVADFILGFEMVASSTISGPEWVTILRAAIEKLPTDFLRGMRPIEHILEMVPPGARYVPKPLPRMRLNSGSDVREVRPNEVCLNCADLSEGWPWHDRPGDPPVATKHILLSRSKRVYYLEALWYMKKGYLYKLDTHSVKISEPADDKLGESLASKDGSVPVGEMILRCFLHALEETVKDIRRQYDQAIEKKTLVAGYISRMET